MIDRSLEVGGRTTGRNAFVNSWTVEKLWKVAEAIAQAKDGDQDALVEAWRNLVKLGTWMAGNTLEYEEEAARAVFEEGEGAMLHHLEELLAPILDARR